MNLRCDCISCKYENQKSNEDPCCHCYNDSEYVYGGEEHNNFPQSRDKDKEGRTMYDELIKRLGTIHPEDYDTPLEFIYGAQKLMYEAAAAIHQLQHHAADWERIADHWRKRCEVLEQQIREDSDAGK